jgi:hypothetical protein
MGIFQRRDQFHNQNAFMIDFVKSRLVDPLRLLAMAHHLQINLERQQFGASTHGVASRQDGKSGTRVALFRIAGSAGLRSVNTPLTEIALLM